MVCRARLAIGVMVWSLAAVAGCTRSPDELPSGVVARVGHYELSWKAFADYVNGSVGTPAASLDSAALAALFEQYLNEELLRATALDRGLVDAEDSRAKAAEALLAEEQSRPIGEQELLAFYQQHRAELERPERIRVAQWLFEEKSSAEQFVSQVRTPSEHVEDAVDAGQANTGQDDTGQDDEDQPVELGELSRDDLPEKLADQLFALRVGGWSAVIDTGGFYSVFLVRARLPAETPSFERVRDQLEGRLRAERTEQARERLIQEARQRYNVVVAESRLPFALGEAAVSEHLSPLPIRSQGSSP